MYKPFRFFITAIIATLLLHTQGHAQTGADLVGKVAPAFEAQSSEGRIVKLSDFRGKITILEWHNPKCPFVKKHYETNNMQALQKYARDEGAIWLTINSSVETSEGYISDQKAQEYYQTNKMNANHYLLDPLGHIGKSYFAKTTPQIVIVDTGGYVAYSGAIDDIPSAKHEDVDKARNYVYSAIDNLVFGKPASPYATQPYGCSIKYKP